MLEQAVEEIKDLVHLSNANVLNNLPEVRPKTAAHKLAKFNTKAERNLVGNDGCGLQFGIFVFLTYAAKSLNIRQKQLVTHFLSLVIKIWRCSPGLSWLMFLVALSCSELGNAAS